MLPPPDGLAAFDTMIERPMRCQALIYYYVTRFLRYIFHFALRMLSLRTPCFCFLLPAFCCLLSPFTTPYHAIFRNSILLFSAGGRPPRQLRHHAARFRHIDVARSPMKFSTPCLRAITISIFRGRPRRATLHIDISRRFATTLRAIVIPPREEEAFSILPAAKYRFCPHFGAGH